MIKKWFNFFSNKEEKSSSKSEDFSDFENLPKKTFNPNEYKEEKKDFINKIENLEFFFSNVIEDLNFPCEFNFRKENGIPIISDPILYSYFCFETPISLYNLASFYDEIEPYFKRSESISGIPLTSEVYWDDNGLIHKIQNKWKGEKYKKSFFYSGVGTQRGKTYVFLSFKNTLYFKYNLGKF